MEMVIKKPTIQIKRKNSGNNGGKGGHYSNQRGGNNGGKGGKKKFDKKNI
jgi:hypothetical protein